MYSRDNIKRGKEEFLRKRKPLSQTLPSSIVSWGDSKECAVLRHTDTHTKSAQQIRAEGSKIASKPI